MPQRKECPRLQTERGQAFAEYAILFMFVILLAIVFVPDIGIWLQGGLTNVNQSFP